MRRCSIGGFEGDRYSVDSPHQHLPNLALGSDLKADASIGVSIMRSRNIVNLLIILGAFLAVPVVGSAQEAVVTGTVTDPTGGVLPGVTITAVHAESGNNFQTVTDGDGKYRLPVRIGSYRITAELQGFASLTRTGVELLVGQQLVVNIPMVPSTLQESVTVVGGAPLVDTTRATLGKAIDPRQMRDLPVNGRNWVDLTMLAPGSRQNASTDEPGTVAGASGVGSFQLNLDGLRVTQNQTSGFGQPH